MPSVIVLEEEFDANNEIRLIVIGYNIDVDSVRSIVRDMHEEIAKYNDEGKTWDYSEVEWIQEHLPSNVKAYDYAEVVYY